MLRPFELHRPSTVEGAVDLVARLGDEAAVYAGGTELLLLLKEGLLRVGHLVDVKRIAGLDAIAVDGDELSIGATVTHRAVERSPVVAARCPLVAQAARHVANVRVRNVGTVAGNLAFADPHSDVATLLVALDEIVTAVRFRPWPARTAAAYVKFGVHERPTLGVAVALVLDGGGTVMDARLAVGCRAAP